MQALLSEFVIIFMKFFSLESMEIHKKILEVFGVNSTRLTQQELTPLCHLYRFAVKTVAIFTAFYSSASALYCCEAPDTKQDDGGTSKGKYTIPSIVHVSDVN